MTGAASLRERIEAEIRARDVTLRAFADQVDIDSAILSRFLTGKQKSLSRGTARKLGAALGISASDMDTLLAPSDERATPDTATRELIRETVHETLAQMGYPRVAPADALLAEGEIYAAAFDAAIRDLPQEYRARLPVLFRDELRRRRREIVAQQ